MRRQVALLHHCNRNVRLFAAQVRLSSTDNGSGPDKPKKPTLLAPENVAALSFADCSHCGKPLKSASTVNCKFFAVFFRF